VEHRPQSVLADGAPIEFNICEEGEYYIDLSNRFLYARASIVKENGENLNEDSEVAQLFAQLVVENRSEP